MDKAITFWLYSTSLITTMAGMEGFSSFAYLFALLSIFFFPGRMDREMLQQLFKSTLAVVLLLFVLAAPLSLIFSPLDSISWQQIFSSIADQRNLIFLFLLAVYWKEYFLNMSDRFFLFLFSFVALVCLYSYVQHFTGIDLIRSNNKNIAQIGDTYLTAGFFSLTLTYAYSLGMFFFFFLPLVAAGLFRQRSRAVNLLTALTMTLIPFSLVATGARGAWVSCVVCLVLLLILDFRRKALVRKLLPILALFSTYFYFNPRFLGRLMTIFSFEYSSNLSRLNIWKSHLEIFFTHPLFGIGYKMNDKVVPDYYQALGLKVASNLSPNHHAHSDFIQILAGMGTLGGIAYLTMAFLFLWISFKGWKVLAGKNEWHSQLCLGAFLAQIYFHTGGFTQCNFIDREVVHMLTYIWIYLVVVGYQFGFLTATKYQPNRS